eukprot:5174398-Amphidinium_carterae.1
MGPNEQWEPAATCRSTSHGAVMAYRCDGAHAPARVHATLSRVREASNGAGGHTEKRAATAPTAPRPDERADHKAPREPWPDKQGDGMSPCSRMGKAHTSAAKAGEPQPASTAPQPDDRADRRHRQSRGPTKEEDGVSQNSLCKD